MSSKRISRRRFIGYGASSTIVGLSSSPLVALFSTILGGVSQKAWAESLGLKPRNWVQIHESGAPARYMCDSFLTPYSSDKFDRNPMLATRFKNQGGRYIGGEYETFERHGIQVPTMWTYDLPTPNDGYRPMSDLLPHFLSIQGVTTRNAGHSGSANWSFLAPGAKKSTTALSADASDAPFAAINLQASGFAFRSTENKSALQLSPSGNVAAALLDPFRPMGSTQFRANRGAIKEAYNRLLPSLDEVARAGHPGAEALIQNRDASLSLLEMNFNDLTTEWNALFNKYQALVRRAIYDPSKPLVGLNDLPIGEGGSGAPGLYNIVPTEDNVLSLHLSTDMRSAVDARTNMPGLANSFAFTEFVLKRKLSSSISFTTGGGIGPFVRESDLVAAASMGNDQHSAGFYPSLYFNVLHHRAVYACLMELVEQLKGANLFSDTVISLSGDFNRNPRVDMTGSDHGFTGKGFAFLSGAFNGPLIVGNLRNDERKGWGAGGVIPQLGRQLTLIDTAVTIAHFLRVPPPFTSALPAVTLGSAGMVSNVGKTQFV
jgi:hypothetical protein